MNLTASLDEPRAHRGPACTVGALLDRLDREEPDQAEILRSLLANPAVQFSTLSRTLRREGVTLSATTLSRHAGRGTKNGSRDRECTCTE